MRTNLVFNSNNTESIHLSIADFNIMVNFLPTDKVLSKRRLIKIIKEEYRGFITNKNKSFIDYKINFTTNEFLLFSKKKPMKAYSLLFEEQTDNIIFSNYHISLDQFNSLLTYILNQLLLEDHGFILHASSVITPKGALIFAGQEEAGKSTIIRLLKGTFDPISDDNLIIKYCGGKFYLFQTPFIERNFVEKSSINKFIIAGIFFPKKTHYFKVREIQNKNSIITSLLQLTNLSKLSSFPTDKHTKNRSMENFNRFISNNKFYYLYFAKIRVLGKLLERYFPDKA